MKYGLIPIFIALLFFSGCDDGLDGEDSYIKIPAIWGSSFNMGRIGALLTDSLYTNTEVTGLWNPKGIAFDEDEGIVFWTDEGYKNLVRYDPVSKKQTIIVSGMNVPEDLDFDPVERKIYWCDSGSKTINRCDEWGGTVETLLTSVDGLSTPTGITLDSQNRQFYFTDEGTTEIRRMNFDGTGMMTVIIVSQAHAITYHQGKIYWNDKATDEMLRCNQDGSNQELLNSTVSNPMGLAIDKEKGYLYYTSFDVSYKLSRCRLDGSQNEIISSAADNIPFLDYGYTRLEVINQLNLPEFPSISF